MKVKEHENPTSAFKKLENIFDNFFEDVQQVKTAWLFYILNEEKYKAVLDTLEQYDQAPSYATLT